MYDYELEKSLEERQAESLEINLNRNKKNRAYSKKMKIVYIFIAALFVVSIGIVLIIGEDIYMNLGVALSIDLFVSALIFAIVRRCPHCGSSLYVIEPYGISGYDMMQAIGTTRCPHCGVNSRRVIDDKETI